MNVKFELELDELAAGAAWAGVEETTGLLRYWNGKRIFISAQSACVAVSC